MKQPSDFAKVDNMASVLNKAEYEIIATNIMTILKHTGDSRSRPSSFGVTTHFVF